MPKEDYIGSYEEVHRTENGKVFDLGQGCKALCCQIGHWHYRGDPGDLREPWKEISTDLNAEAKYLAMPYMTAEFSPDGAPQILIRHRNGRDWISMHLADAGGLEDGDKNYQAKEKKGRVWKGGGLSIEGVGQGGIKVAYAIVDDKASHVLRFKVAANDLKWIGDEYDPERGGTLLMQSGSILWTPFYAVDAAGKPVKLFSRYADGLLELEVVPGEKPVYPIIIDPTVMTQEQVAASADDGSEREDTGSTYITAQQGYWNAPTLPWWSLIRFQIVPIPADADIDSASVQFNVYSTSYDDPSTYLHCEKGDAAAITAGTANFNISSRTRTTANVFWDADGVGTGWKTSPDIAAPVEETVKSGLWSLNDDLAVIGDSTNNNDDFSINCWDYSDHTYAPKFDCTYTAAAGGVSLRKHWAAMGLEVRTPA